MLASGLQTKQYSKISIPEVVQELTYYYKGLWWGSDGGFPLLSPVYPTGEQQMNGVRLDHLTGDLINTLRQPYRSNEERVAARDRFLGSAEAFGRDVLGFEERHFNFIHNHPFGELVAEFVNKARTFDPDISADDIYQASRNVWSMAIMQLILGLKVEITPAVFAYSMLYPYTDNLLDNPAISTQAKVEFNQHFSQRLAGENLNPTSPVEKTIWNLIEMVENQFSRDRFTHLYDSLTAIQEAQTRSLGLIQAGISPFLVDVLGLSIEKGGAAVLADGYLVAGELTAAQRQFMFGYGVFTQLMDDQEDVKRDLDAGLQTVYSMTAQHWPLDEVTNRTYHFASSVLHCMDSFEGPDVMVLKEIFARGIGLVLADTAGRHSGFYTRRYLAELEKYLPFRYTMLNRQRRRLARYKLTMGRLMELAV